MEIIHNKSDQYQEKAIQSYHSLMQHYYIKEEKLYLEHWLRKNDDRQVSYLWPYSGVISALNALVKIPYTVRQFEDDLVRVLEGLEHYWNPKSNPPAYDSYVLSEGGGQQFFDDNEWLGLEFVEAYRSLKIKEYLQKAIHIFEYIISGWSEDLKGGIYWRDDKITKNTCSNGPAAVLALKLFEETQETLYVELAQKILAWCSQLKSPKEGVYWDNMNPEGEIDRHKYTYNTGTILHANALLFNITKDKTYLDEANSLAQASLTYFTKREDCLPFEFYPNSPWFNVILFKGFLALYDTDPDHSPIYIDSMRRNADYAWTHARDSEGLFSKDWTGKTGVNQRHKWLLDQAPMIEYYALLAAYQQTF